MGSTKYESVGIDELHEDEDNARQHPPRNLKAIKASLQKWGQVEPLVVQLSTNRVIGGNGRLRVMKELGWTKVDVRKLDVDNSQAKLLGIALNRLGELAVWDEVRLAGNLEAAGQDFEAIGFEVDEISALLELAKQALEFETEDIADLTDDNPSAGPSKGPKPEPGTFSVVLTPEQRKDVTKALNDAKKQVGKGASLGDALHALALAWMIDNAKVGKRGRSNPNEAVP